jgi:hypothetical protein
VKKLYEFIVSLKKIEVTNLQTGAQSFYSIKQYFFSGKFKIVDLKKGDVYTLREFAKPLGLYGRNEITVVSDNLNLVISYKQFFKNFKFELQDIANHTTVTYLDNDWYIIKKADIEIGYFEIISMFNPILAISKAKYNLYLLDESLDITINIFYALSFQILHSGDNGN